MSPDVPPAPPEADVIRLAREATGMTAQSAAEASKAQDPAGRGISAAYWRDVERGHGGRRGERVATRASARALAAMARVVGVMPPQLTAAGREDGARVLEEILRREGRALTARFGADDFPEATDEMFEAMRPHLDEIRIRAEIARRRHRDGPLTGAMIFPSSTLYATTWDLVASAGWDPDAIPLAMAALLAWREERSRNGSASGTAAGLRRYPALRAL